MITQMPLVSMPIAEPWVEYVRSRMVHFIEVWPRVQIQSNLPLEKRLAPDQIEDYLAQIKRLPEVWSEATASEKATMIAKSAFVYRVVKFTVWMHNIEERTRRA